MSATSTWRRCSPPHVGAGPLRPVRNANPRHGHGTVFRDRASEIPEDKVLIPGAVDTTTNFVKHPDRAQRLERFMNILGTERVVAG